MKISIIGGGYVGLVSAVCFADLGHFVSCIENDSSKFNALQSGKIPFYEPALQEKFTKTLDRQSLRIHSKIDASIFESEIIMLAVGTPMSSSGQANLTALFSAVAEIISQAKDTPFESLIITTKSTVPVGTGKKIKTIVAEAGLSNRISIASNPEFLREGSAVYDFFHPDRIIIGSEDEIVFNKFKSLYKSIFKSTRPIVNVSLETAELSKYASNTFLATKISFINELSKLCDKVGADIRDTARLMGMDGRIGKYFLNPSPGYGGSCFPKDTHALQYIGKENGIDLQVVSAAIKANNLQIQHCFSIIKNILNYDLNGKTVSILGTSFKPNTDDIRESASLKLIDLLLKHDATVHVTDPEALKNTEAIYKNTVQYFNNPYDCVTSSDALVLMTEWNSYRNMDLKLLKSEMRDPNFIDFRLIYTKSELLNAGFSPYILGQGLDTTSSLNIPCTI